MRTLLTAAPASAITDSSAKRRRRCPVTGRRASPMSRHAQGRPSAAAAAPIVRDRRGVRTPKPAKQSTGNVVINPAVPPDTCRSCCRSSSAAPTLVTAVRIDRPGQGQSDNQHRPCDVGRRRGHPVDLCRPATPTCRAGRRRACTLATDRAGCSRWCCPGATTLNGVRERGVAVREVLELALRRSLPAPAGSLPRAAFGCAGSRLTCRPEHPWYRNVTVGTPTSVHAFWPVFTNCSAANS